MSAAGPAGFGHDVPGAGLEHEAERTEAPRHGACGAAIGDLDGGFGPHRIGQRRQQARLVGALEPVDRVEMEALRDLLRAEAAALGQGGRELELRRQELVGEAELRRGARQARQEQRLGLVLGEAGELGAKAVEQLEAAARPAIGIDRHAGGAELLDVAIDGADRDLERRRQLVGGQPAAGLQHQQDRQQAACAHGAILTGHPDSTCQVR